MSIQLNLLTKNIKNFDDLANALNPFIRDVRNILDKRLTISENINAEVKTINLDGKFPIYLEWTRPDKPELAILGALRRIDGTAFTLSSAVTIDWEWIDNKIKIKGIPGLTTSNTAIYEAKILFLVG